MTSSNASSASSLKLSQDELKLLQAKLRSEQQSRLMRERLKTYRPYAKQMEFHAAGNLPVRERLFMAGNQLGKTWSGAAETAMHLTGIYPDWWEGRRFDGPITAMAGSVSSELTRDGVQRLLVGPPASEAEWGTGMIPRDSIIDWNRRIGTPNGIDTITVKHRYGGTSTLLFKAYEQGREKWQANTVNFVWFDEEPPADVYSEGVTRTNATKGSVILTFTPLMGMSEVVRRFLNEPSPGRRTTTMTIYDAGHYTKEEADAIVATYPEHERDARARGVPMFGSGLVFPISDETVAIEPVQLAEWWPRIGGLDFGWDHPFAAVELAWDRDRDIVYLTREHKVRQQTPEQHCAILKKWTKMPWAWPHDGLQHDKGSGEQLAKHYKREGLLMLGERATFSDGTFGVEAGLFDMLERMRSGRFKVFTTCQMWLEERRMYHREDGKIVKEFDDLISASRYAMMMLRHARVPSSYRGADVARKLSAEGVGEVIW